MPRVLVIDDNRDMRELMRVILEGAGYSVDLAEDGEVGAHAVLEKPFEQQDLLGALRALLR